jgi:ABC-type dipeptide/oligopeptide/nickel transport system permease subunit
MAPPMPVVVALFASNAAAEAAELAIGRACSRGGECLIQRHTRVPFDGNSLPDGATEFGRNIVIAMVAGGLFMATAGALAGAFDLMLGMGIGMGIALGFVTGLLMGLVGAMQAGTRIPKPALRGLVARFVPGGAILVVEIDAARVDEVETLLEPHAPVAVERC